MAYIIYALSLAYGNIIKKLLTSHEQFEILIKLGSNNLKDINQFDGLLTNK